LHATHFNEISINQYQHYEGVEGKVEEVERAGECDAFIVQVLLEMQMSNSQRPSVPVPISILLLLVLVLVMATGR